VRNRSLLRLIAVASEEHLALPPLLRAWAADERGLQQRRVLRLAQLLEQGTPLADAVEQVPGALSDEDVLGIRFGTHSGMLTAAIRQSLEENAEGGLPRRLRFESTVKYLLVVGVVGLLVVTFMLIKIFPSLHNIFGDFNLVQPAALTLVEQWFNLLAHYWWMAVLAVLILIWSAFSPRPGRFFRNSVLARIIGPLKDLRTVDVLQKLSLALNAGRPLSGALSTLARYHHEAGMRNKLLFSRNEIEQGVEVWQSLADARLLQPQEVSLMRSAERVGNSSWVLGHVVTARKARTERRLQRLAEFFLPTVVFALGSFVLLLSLSVFLTIVRLIEALT
jgi:type II secretory pathway component PulF